MAGFGMGGLRSWVFGKGKEFDLPILTSLVPEMPPLRKC